MKRDSKRASQSLTHPLLQRAQREGAPLLDAEHDGTTLRATFVCQSRAQPILKGDFNDWADGDGKQLKLEQAAPGLWTRTLTLPRDAYIEYVFMVGRKRRLDPFNPRRADNGFGGFNSAAYLPGAQPEPLAQRKRGVRAGEVTRHSVAGGDEVVGGRRTVHLYKPPADEACPLLIVLDGGDYLRRASVCEIVDNLIAQHRIRPIGMALVDGSKSARYLEYACSDAHASFLSHTIISFAGERLHLDATPGAHGILGASMGGVMALYTAMRAPHVFGRVISQSGAFSLDQHDGEYDLVIFDLVKHMPATPVRIQMAVGTMEWLLHTNRRMHTELTKRGYDVRYREFAGGHNYTCWRDDLVNGLTHAFAA